MAQCCLSSFPEEFTLPGSVNCEGGIGWTRPEVMLRKLILQRSGDAKINHVNELAAASGLTDGCVGLAAESR
jgi:hypothetical protein